MTEEEEITGAHPLQTGRYDLYAEAQRLVGERHEKGDLVDLVNWLLVERERALDEARYYRAAIETAHQLQEGEALPAGPAWSGFAVLDGAVDRTWMSERDTAPDAPTTTHT